MKPGSKQEKIPLVLSWWRPEQNCCLPNWNARGELGRRGGHRLCPSSLQSTAFTKHVFTDNGPVTALTCCEDPTKPYKCNPAPGRQNTEQSHRSQPQLAHVGLAAPVASLISLALMMSAHLLRIIVVTVILILINANHSNVSKCKTMSFGSH